MVSKALLKMIILIMIGTSFTGITVSSPASGERAELRGGEGERNGIDHLLLTEICVTPTAGEFIEIHNPTQNQVPLGDYYLADITDYYNIVNSVPGFDQSGDYDFVAGFPAGAAIAPGEYQVMAGDSGEFKAQYGFVPTYCLLGSDCPGMDDTKGFIGNTPTLTNGHETVVLFHWDGASDLVADVDIAWWGDDGAYRVDKSGVSIDSEFDGNGAQSSYNADASSYPPIHSGPHDQGKSYRRVEPYAESQEVDNGGNGITGHDETTENLTLSWNFTEVADPTVFSGDAAPFLRDMAQEPEGNPVPGSNVVVTVNATDAGTVEHVNISVSIGFGPYSVHEMNNVGENKYSYTIGYSSPPMGMGVSVRYNVSAVDDEGNVRYSDDEIYYYLPDRAPTLNITEVLLNVSGTDNKWVELHCLDDGNSGNGNSILGWIINDLDSTNDKVFRNVLVRTGEIVLLHFNDTGHADEMNSSDGNDDGIIDVYTGHSNLNIDCRGDQMVLLGAAGVVVDAVCWSFDDTLPYYYEQNDLNYTADIGQWNSKLPRDCVDTENVLHGYSISRKEDDPDTNSRADWYVLDVPNPGTLYNTTDLAPVIHEVMLEPEPENGTLPPGTDIKVTVRATDDFGILSGNITRSLDGEAQAPLAIRDDGAGADENAGDDNHTALLAGGDEGSRIVFSVEVFDTSLQRRESREYTVDYTTPRDDAVLLITEVMIEPLAGHDWIELYCIDDNNPNGGYDLNGWKLDDVDGEEELIFGDVSVNTGEYVLVHMNEEGASETDSLAGNGDGIVDVYATASDSVLDGNADQLVLFNSEGQAVDGLAWRGRDTLSVNEENDMKKLPDWGVWSGDTAESCIDIQGLEEGTSIARKYNHDTYSYLDGDRSSDWYFDMRPIAGAGGHSPRPDLELTVLMDGPETADRKFTVTWDWDVEWYCEHLNVSLYHCQDASGTGGSFVSVLDPAAETFDWDVSRLQNGSYYLKVTVNDTIHDEYETKSTDALTILHLLPEPPEIVITSPANGEHSVSTGAKINVTLDREMDLDSFSLSGTYSIEPAVAGSFGITGDNRTVIFTPDAVLDHNTTYVVSMLGLKGAKGGELSDPFRFAFRTQVLFRVVATVFPADASVTFDGILAHLSKEGRFLFELPNGTHALVISAPGFEIYESNVSVHGWDRYLGKIELIEDTIPKTVTIGPFLDESTGKGISGIRITFELDGVIYSNLTDPQGYAEFNIPTDSIPGGTDITAEKDGTTEVWKFDQDDAPLKKFGQKDKANKGEGFSLLWIIIIILGVLIVGVSLAIIVVLFRGKGEEDAVKEEPEAIPPDAPVGGIQTPQEAGELDISGSPGMENAEHTDL